MTGRPRLIDYDAVTRLRATGLSVAECSRRLGISDHSVRYASDPEFRARVLAVNSQRRYWATPCPACGVADASRHREGALCQTCRADERTESVRETTLRCATCREWKADGEFSPKPSVPRRRGRDAECRSCAASRKREYRQRKARA
jgi:hypothetical protein